MNEIHVPRPHEAPLPEVTYGEVSKVIGGDLIPNAAFIEAMARKLRGYMEKEIARELAGDGR